MTPPSAGAAGLPPLPAAAAAGALLLVLVALMVWRRMKPKDPGEAAFDAIARALRLSRAERLLVRELAAAHGRAAPVALLLSEHALREAMAAARGVEDDGRVDALAKKLEESARRLAA